ncbi:MAG: hypothetical protein IPJ13_32575 [Saprospiraceae bacterium]|nr:hypothetical protein [Saprospiraceae bacterium]
MVEATILLFPMDRKSPPESSALKSIMQVTSFQPSSLTISQVLICMYNFSDAPDAI